MFGYLIVYNLRNSYTPAGELVMFVDIQNFKTVLTKINIK